MRTEYERGHHNRRAANVVPATLADRERKSPNRRRKVMPIHSEVRHEEASCWSWRPRSPALLAGATPASAAAHRSR